MDQSKTEVFIIDGKYKEHISISHLVRDAKNTDILKLASQLFTILISKELLDSTKFLIVHNIYPTECKSVVVYEGMTTRRYNLAKNLADKWQSIEFKIPSKLTYFSYNKDLDLFTIFKSDTPIKSNIDIVKNNLSLQFSSYVKNIKD